MTDYKALLENHDTVATTLLTICIRAFQDPKDERGITVFRWDPYTLLLEVKSQFDADLPEVNAMKIQALIGVLTSKPGDGVFWTDASAFNKVCLTLCDEGEKIGYDKADPEQMAWTICEIQMLLGEDTRQQFKNDVPEYVGLTLASEGIYDPPPMLSFAQRTDKFVWPDQDSDMFTALWKRQAEQVQEVKDFVQQRLTRLSGELNQIPGLNIRAADPQQVGLEQPENEPVPESA